MAKSKSKRPKKPGRARGHTRKTPQAPVNDLVMMVGNPRAQHEFSQAHAAFIEQMPYLWETIDVALKPIHDRDLTWHDVIVLSLARMGFEDFRQILLLCSNGETTGGMKILRGMFERVVAARYIDKNPEEAEAFINFFPVSRYKEALAASDFFSEEDLAKLKAERDEVIERYAIRERCKHCKEEQKRFNHTWTRVDIPRMAEIARVKLPTVTGYYLPMQETHATLASISRRLKLTEDSQDFVYDDVGTFDESQITLVTAHYLVLAAIECLRDRFKLEELIEDRFSQCLQGFNQVLTAAGVVVDDKRKSSTD
jgi:hypothetical protein